MSPDEFAHGKGVLVEKLEHAGAPLVIFTFKKTATVVLGPFEGAGLLQQRRLGAAEVFVMPGPYAARAEAQRELDVLRQLASRSR